MCFAYVTVNSLSQYLMLSCSWDGGLPKVLLWWEGPGLQGKGGQEASNVLTLPYGTARSERPYTCYARHPLLAQTKTCTVPLGQCALRYKPGIQVSLRLHVITKRLVYVNVTSLYQNI